MNNIPSLRCRNTWLVFFFFCEFTSFKVRNHTLLRSSIVLEPMLCFLWEMAEWIMCLH